MAASTGDGGYEGYATIGKLMGHYPQLALFRRFGALNAQNLLYLQAELTHLELELRNVEGKNSRSSDLQKQDYTGSWWKLRQGYELQVSQNPTGERHQWEIILNIREKLKEYNAQLLEQSQIAKLQHPEGPDHRDLQVFKDWMERPEAGNIGLTGDDCDTWSENNVPDLVALLPRTPASPFADWAGGRFLEWVQERIRKKKPDVEKYPYLKGTANYSDSTISIVVRQITSVVASLLPVLSIVILFWAPSMPARLGVIAGLTSAFSFTLTAFTVAELKDIFAVTAAYAAVCVVFVGSNNLPSASSSTVCNCTVLST